MIKVENLIFNYGDLKVKAIDDISFTINEGEYVAIIGHNGSGKSTLSKLLVGLLKPKSGSIKINNIVITRKNLPKIRKIIGVVFQNPENQFVGSTVEDDIAFGLENQKLSREKMRSTVIQLGKAMGVEKILNKEPHNLSGGQKQRVAICSTLALSPKIIIFDEVTSMLDPKGKTDILNIIHNIQKNENKTLISITHDMDEAFLADKVLVMSQGKVVAYGIPSEILSNQEIIKIAKIDNPFVYKISEKLSKVLDIEPTFSEKELVRVLCK